MKHTIIISDDAEDDLASLFDYVADQSGRRRAFAYVDRIYAACGSLSHFPHRGAPRDDLAPGLRTMSFEGRAVIVYRVDETTVRIVRIFSAGRDVDAELSDP